MLDINTVTQSIEAWIKDFVEIPHPALGGWAPCPYARRARLANDYLIQVGADPHSDLLLVAQHGLNGRSVIILAYDPDKWCYSLFATAVQTANQEILPACDLIALEDHPADPELVNGVTMNHGTYALILIQNLSDLNQKAQTMASKGFYDTWHVDYLNRLFKHRQDPRK